MADTIDAIARVDIPVVGHIGLTPQSYHRMGGHKVQGRSTGTRGRAAGAAARRRRRRRAGRRLRRRARGRARARSPPRSRPSCRSRRSASAPGPTATARCSCCTTCSGSPTCSSSSPSGTPTCARRRSTPPRRTSTTSAAAPGPTTSTPSTDRPMELPRPTALERCRRGRPRGQRRAGRVGVRADDGRAARRPPVAGRRSPAERCDDVVVSIFVNPLQFDRAADFDAYPRPIDDDVARCARRRRRRRLRADRGRRCTRPASRPTSSRAPLAERDGGRGPARALPRRDDGRHQAVRRRAARRRGVRREGLPAAGDHPPDDGGPRPRDRDRRRADRARARRAGDVQPQRAPRPRRPDGRRVRAPRPSTPPSMPPCRVPASRRSSQPPGRGGRQRAAGRDWITSPCSIPTTLEPLDDLDRPGRVAIAVWFDDIRLIDNRPLP